MRTTGDGVLPLCANNPLFLNIDYTVHQGWVTTFKEASICILHIFGIFVNGLENPFDTWWYNNLEVCVTVWHRDIFAIGPSVPTCLSLSSRSYFLKCLTLVQEYISSGGSTSSEAAAFMQACIYSAAWAFSAIMAAPTLCCLLVCC
jgi:hypothetical protein